MEFVVLPDHPTAEKIAGRLPHEYRARVVSHHSGRPWIVGDWADDELVLASAGTSRLALLGCTGATPESLTGQLEKVAGIDDLDRLAANSPGCFHLVASIGGRVRAQGSLSTACQIFYGEVAGATVASDQPQTIARLTGAGIEEELLALHLLSPYGPPWPLSGRCVWRGVHVLPTGSQLDLGPQEPPRLRRWWVPPEPEVPLATVAPLLREALLAAVRARTTGVDRVSADLSGGLDSTSLCFLVARLGIPLVTTHYESADPANEDLTWAAECRDLLKDAQHLVVPPDEVPAAFAEVRAAGTDLEGPHSFVNSGVTEHLARLLAATGSTRHLTGHGSDELFQPSVTCLHALVRRRPLRSLRHARAVRSMRRWTWHRLLRNLVPNPPFDAWLARAAETCAGSDGRPGQVGWELPLRLPPWATPDAVETVRGLLRRSAESDPAPLAPLPVQHEMLRLTQINGTAVRQSSRIGARSGVSFQAPYIDDRVLELAMSIRLADRARVGQVKPALGAVLRGLVPDHLLDRRTKADASWISYAGLRRYRRELAELSENSQLARLGLVDAARLRDGFLGLHADGNTLALLGPTFKTELWLRAATRHVGEARTALASVPGGRA